MQHTDADPRQRISRVRSIHCSVESFVERATLAYWSEGSLPSVGDCTLDDGPGNDHEINYLFRVADCAGLRIFVQGDPRGGEGRGISTGDFHEQDGDSSPIRWLSEHTEGGRSRRGFCEEEWNPDLDRAHHCED